MKRLRLPSTFLLTRSFTSTSLPLKDKTLLRSQGFIDGRWIDSPSSKFDVRNPATGEVLTQLPDMGTEETRHAIEAAAKVNVSWRNTPAKKRAALLRKWFELIVHHKEDLASILTAEQGKPLSEALGEIIYASGFIELFSEEATRTFGDIIPPPHDKTRILVHRSGVGVVGAITPWNFPSAMITRKCAAALAAGCPVVLKPSDLTPLSALALAELCQRAGFPNGVFNVVVGTDAAKIGNELTGNFNVRKITFTGSTRVGKVLLRQCADNVQRISLELGGNAPFIVFDDCDVDKAVAGAILCKFRNAGQTCVSANRIFVQDKIYDLFARKLTIAVKELRLGNGLRGGVQIGPLINYQAVKKVESHIKDALEKGGQVLTGGKVENVSGEYGPVTTGLLFQPTVITNANKDMAFFQEETFGPVAALYKFSSEGEVLHLANNTRAGLASYFYTSDVSRIFRFSESLEYGMIGVNQPIVSHPTAPFGGVKESGMGREGSHLGLNDYLNVVTVHLGLD